MQDDLSSLPRGDGASRRGRSGRAVAVLVAAVLLLGVALAAWLGWREGWIQVTREPPEAALRAAGEAPVQPRQLPRDSFAGGAAVESASARLAGLEARMAELSLAADAAAAKTMRAEALLVALAARRAVERGAPLGYLEDQLRLRFGDTQPNAVERLREAGADAVTIDSLTEGFEQVVPRLTGSAPDEGSWQRVRRELSGLFVVRRGEAPGPGVPQRVDRARRLLHAGRVDAALSEVAQLPKAEAAAEWSARARRYIATERALDLIETAALLDPQRTPVDGDGTTTPAAEEAVGAF